MRHHLRLPLSAFVTAATLASGFQATYATAATRNPWAVDWRAATPSTPAGPVALPAVHFDPTVPAVAPAPSATTRVAIDLGDDQQSAGGQEGVNARPRSFEYSHAYEVRRKIHVYASFATLPLFATEIYLGEKLYRGGFTDAERTAHKWVAGGLEGLFALNTVTGLWNLKEGWKDPAHHKLRVAHGLLMLGADAGFAATGALAPNRFGENGSRTGHRAMAYVSIGVATAGYLIMLLGR